MFVLCVSYSVCSVVCVFCKLSEILRVMTDILCICCVFGIVHSARLCVLYVLCVFGVMCALCEMCVA